MYSDVALGVAQANAVTSDVQLLASNVANQNYRIFDYFDKQKRRLREYSTQWQTLQATKHLYQGTLDECRRQRNQVVRGRSKQYNDHLDLVIKHRVEFIKDINMQLQKLRPDISNTAVVTYKKPESALMVTDAVSNQHSFSHIPKVLNHVKAQAQALLGYTVSKVSMTTGAKVELPKNIQTQDRHVVSVLPQKNTYSAYKNMQDQVSRLIRYQPERIVSASAQHTMGSTATSSASNVASHTSSFLPRRLKAGIALVTGAAGYGTYQYMHNKNQETADVPDVQAVPVSSSATNSASVVPTSKKSWYEVVPSLVGDHKPSVAALGLSAGLGIGYALYQKKNAQKVVAPSSAPVLENVSQVSNVVKVPEQTIRSIAVQHKNNASIKTKQNQHVKLNHRCKCAQLKNKTKSKNKRS